MSFYSQDKLMQSVAADLARLGRFAEASLVAVRKVTRDEIEATAAAIAKRVFVDVWLAVRVLALASLASP